MEIRFESFLVELLITEVYGKDSRVTVSAEDERRVFRNFYVFLEGFTTKSRWHKDVL